MCNNSEVLLKISNHFDPQTAAPLAVHSAAYDLVNIYSTGIVIDLTGSKQK